MKRDYSSIYNIKDFAITNIAPRYLNMDEVNDLNIGLLGIVTELIGNIAEDGFNTTTTYLNEIFPNKAILPETIYSYAAMFQEDDIFATPAEMMAWLFVLEDDIINNSTVVSTSSASSSQKEFFIDSDLSIDVEGVHFMLDYDIRITYVKPNNNTTLYTAAYKKERYGTTYASSLDTDNAHYIKSRVIKYNNQNYLAMYVKLHQVIRHSIEETVIGNDVINAPFFKVRFTGDISSFEVFCKRPDETGYTQLKKKLIGSAPEKDVPFCYYRLSSDDELEVSFTMKDGYYKPDFGSDVIIDYTTTLGKAGEFELYTGSDIICTGNSTVYDYNNRLIVFCITQSPSQFAEDKMSLEALKYRNVENMSTVKSYTTDNDIDLYFSRFTNDDNVKMYTIKKRNDYQDRLFSSFSLYRDSNGDIIKTNTLDLNVKAITDESGAYVNSFDRFTDVGGTSSMFIPAGSIFVYDDESKTNVVLTDYDINTYEESTSGVPFVYTNPFMIYLTRDPSIIGYYRNTIDDSYSMDYAYINENSFVQFMCNTFNIKRNAITGTDIDRHRYNVSILMTPTSDLRTQVFEGNLDYVIISAIDGDNTYVLGIFSTVTGEPYTGDIPDEFKSVFDAKLYFNESGVGEYVPLTITHYDTTSHVFTLETHIDTDDYISETEFRVTNSMIGTVVDGVSTVQNVNSRMVDMYDSVISVTTSISGNITNRYVTMTPHITFIEPLNMCASNVSFNKAAIINTIPGNSRPQDPDELNTFLSMVDTYIDTVPLVGAEILRDDTLRNEFFEYYTDQYDYIEDILDNITNNYSIDLKFYNTYGYSKYFHVENGDPIDSVNIKIAFRIKPVHGTDGEALTRDIKYFIKSYIENINDESSNAIYVSNLIKELETEFDAIKYIKFDGITGIQKYSLDTQAIENISVNTKDMTAAERRKYVPEYLTIDIDDVLITLI